MFKKACEDKKSEIEGNYRHFLIDEGLYQLAVTLFARIEAKRRAGFSDEYNYCYDKYFDSYVVKNFVRNMRGARIALEDLYNGLKAICGVLNSGIRKYKIEAENPIIVFFDSKSFFSNETDININEIKKLWQGLGDMTDGFKDIVNRSLVSDLDNDWDKLQEFTFCLNEEINNYYRGERLYYSFNDSMYTIESGETNPIYYTKEFLKAYDGLFGDFLATKAEKESLLLD